MHFFNGPTEIEPLESDRQLLKRFAVDRDQGAFGLLVRRYGNLVHRVCRGVGLDSHDADDVFQATFLIVAQKARTSRVRRSLAAFIHITSYRLALNLLRCGRRVRFHERGAARPESVPAKSGQDAEISFREALSVVDAELVSMADKYRIPLVMHFLQGKSQREIAGDLGLSERTLSRRIEQGRELLQRRLAKRGIEVIASLFLALYVGKSQATVPPALAAATAKAAALFVTGSAPATKATLMASSAASGVSKLTGPAKVAATIKLWMGKTAVVALIGGVCAGVWYETRPNLRRPSGLGGSSTDLSTSVPSGPIVVRGRILDEEGLPVPQARVTLLAARGVRGELGLHDDVLVQGNAGADGAFTLEVPQDFPFWIRGNAKLLASAPDHALSAAAVSLKPGSVSKDIRIANEGAVRGQVTDKDNRPVAGVAVYVVGLGPVCRETIQGTDDPRPDPLTGWPQPVITDHAGQFEIAGLAPKLGVRLEVRDDRLAHQLLVLQSAEQRQRVPARREKVNDSTLSPENLTIKLAPPQCVEGQVLAADTGKPLPFARLSMVPCESLEGLRPEPELRHHVDALADEEGRFRMQPLPGGKFQVFACGQDNDPYLTLVQEVPWPAGTVRQEITLALPRGILVQGQVVESGTDLPVFGARVEYTAYLARNDVPPNQYLPRLAGEGVAHTGKDGRFFIPVLSGRGELRVQFHDDRYLLGIPEGAGPGAYVASLARLPLECLANSSEKEVRLVVRRSGQLGGLVVDGAGEPVSAGTLLTSGRFKHHLFRGERRFQVHDGGFLLSKVEADSSYPVVLVDAANKQGVSLTLFGEVHDLVPTFRLEPCGSATGELTAENGRGLANAPIDLAAVLTFAPAGKQVEDTETAWYQALNRDEPTTTTSRGKFVLPALVPGLRYRLYAGAGSSRQLVREFTVEPGQRLQLGSFVVRN